jgi:hypothetical protein
LMGIATLLHLICQAVIISRLIVVRSDLLMYCQLEITIGYQGLQYPHCLVVVAISIMIVRVEVKKITQ